MRKIREHFLKLKYRERILCFLAICAVGILSLKLFVLDGVQQILTLKEKISAVEMEKTRAGSNLESIKESKSVDAKKDPLWSYRNENMGLASFMKILGNVDAKREDLTVRRIASEKQEITPDFEKTTLQMEIDTPFNSLGKLLEEIEGSKLLTRVEKIQIIRIENELRLCRARIMLNAYSWRNP
jgi:hypothetical protein